MLDHYYEYFRDNPGQLEGYNTVDELIHGLNLPSHFDTCEFLEELLKYSLVEVRQENNEEVWVFPREKWSAVPNLERVAMNKQDKVDAMQITINEWVKVCNGEFLTATDFRRLIEKYVGRDAFQRIANEDVNVTLTRCEPKVIARRHKGSKNYGFCFQPNVEYKVRVW